MAGIPNRKKAISLVAISTPGDVKTYPTGTYCVPADGDGTFLLSDSTVPAQFSWSSGSSGSISYDKTTGATNITTLTASNAYVVNTLAVGNYIQLFPVSNVIPSNTTASYIYVSGSTNDIYFTQYKPSSSIANTTRLRWLEGSLETGLLHGGRLSTVTGTTTFSIADGSGIVVSTNAGYDEEPYPSVKYVQWNAFVSQSLPSIGASQITYIAIDSSGSIVKSSIPFSDGDFSNYIILGRILHQSGSVTNGAVTAPGVAYGTTQNKVDFFRAFGPLKISGHALSPSGSTLGLLKDAGTSFAIGRNYTVDPNMPNYISATTDTALTASKIYREYVSGSTLVLDTGIANAGYGEIDPTKRLVSSTGLLASVPPAKYTTQRAFWFPNSINKAIHVYYGNTEYNSIADAQAGISTESFVEDRYTSTEAIFLGYIIVKSGTTSLATDAQIIQAGFARGIGGGGGGGSAASGTPIGPAGGDLSGSYPDPTLALITTAGTSGSATVVPVITIDAKGRVTTMTSAPIQIAESQVTNLTTDLTILTTNYNDLSSSYYPLSSSYYNLSSSFISVSSSINSLSSSYYPLSSSFYSLSSSYYPLSSSFVTLSSSVNTLSSSLAAVSSSNNGKVAKAGDTMTGNLLVSGTAKIGIGTLSPLASLHVAGTGSTSIIQSDIGYEINPVLAPTTLSAAVLAVSGNVETGSHKYYVTYGTALGETQFYFGVGNAGIGATTTSGSQQVRLTVPTSSDYRVTSRKLYRTKIGGNYWDAYLLATISDNSTTTYDDNISDSALGATTGYYRENTTSKYFTQNGSGFMVASNQNTAVGVGALANVFNGTILGSENTVFGAGAGGRITSGPKNIFIGPAAGYGYTTADSGIAIGHSAGYNANSGGSIIIGRNAGYNLSNVNNVVIGGGAGATGTTANNNVIIGTGAGYYITSAAYNICIGRDVAYNLQNGTHNIILGTWVNAVSAGSVGTLNIGNVVYGTNLYTGYPGSSTPTAAGSIAIGIQTPTARFHLPAGGTAASSAPLKFMSGSLLATPESGSVEFNGDKLYLTITSSAARKEFALNDAAISVDRVVYTTTNGRLTGSFIQVTPASNFVNIVGSLNVSSSLTVTGSVTIANNRIDNAWTSYTPIWSSDGATAPTLGNGTITGAYKQIGKTVFVRVKLTLGTTSTTGDGAWTISLPVTAANADGVQMPCSLLDSGVSWYAGIVNGGYKGQTDRTAIITTASPAGAVFATSPFTWGSGDSLQFNGSYEAV